MEHVLTWSVYWGSAFGRRLWCHTAMWVPVIVVYTAGW